MGGDHYYLKTVNQAIRKISISGPLGRSAPTGGCAVLSVQKKNDRIRLLFSSVRCKNKKKAKRINRDIIVLF